jgi:phosphoglycolate phosphatase
MNGQLSQIDNVLFDLDGTLVDSSETITTCIHHALDRVGVPVAPDMRMDAFIGLSLLDIFRKEFDLTQAQSEAAIVYYRDHFDALGQADSRVYEDMHDVLADLKSAGYRLFIATVKPTSIAEKVLSDLQLRAYFEGVSGASMGHERRDKAGIITHAIKTYALDPARSIMIGDRAQDISGARHNGLVSVAVTYGFGSREELHAARPDHTVDRSRDIASLLSQAV